MVMERNLVKVGNREVKKRYIGNRLIFEDLGDRTESISGEEVYTDNADDSVVHVEVDGKSYQHAGSGKNLASSEAFLLGNTFFGSNTSPFRYVEMPEVMAGIFSVKPNTEYIISYSQEYETRRVSLFTTSEAIGEIPLRDYTYSSKVGFATENEITVAIAIQRKDGAPVSEEDRFNANFQLEEGSTATAYEPPAPTPDYPIEIHSLNDFDVVSSSKPRNVLVNGDFSTGAPGWAHRYNVQIWDEERQALIVRYTYMNQGVVFQEKELKKDSKYFVRFQGIVTGETLGSFVYGTFKSSDDVPNDRIEVNLTNYSTGHSFIESGIVTPTSSEYKYFGIANSGGNNQLRIKNILIIDLTSTFGDGNEPSLEECNSVFKEWYPAPEDITESDNHPLIDKINLSLNEPLRSVGDVKDRIFRDTDGLWKAERNVGEAQIGDNDIASISIGVGNNVTITRNIDNMTPSYNTPFRSTHYRRMESPGNRWGTIGNRGTATANSVGSMWLSVDKENIDTVEKAKNWFEDQRAAGSPVTVQYALATPTIETLDQDIQDKLNNLRSFQDSNYVYTTVSENLKPMLHTTFKSKGWYDYYLKTLLK